MLTILSIILAATCFFQSTDVFAAAAVARQRQMQQAQQQAIQQAQEEAMIQQYRAAQEQAIAQQIQAQQEQMIAIQIRQAQEQAMAEQIFAQVQAQKVAYANAMNQRRKQVVDAQQSAMVQAQAMAIQQAVVQKAAQEKVMLDAAKMAQVQQLAQAQAEAAVIQAAQAKQQMEAMQVAAAGKAAMSRDRPFENVDNSQVRDVVDIADVWRKLDTDSRSWALMIDNQAKVATVSEYIDRFAKQRIKIQGPPIEYVHMIDDVAMQNPTLLNSPFKDVLQLVAIMQYDFDNGMDRDMIAKKALGEDLYLANKKRLGR